MQKYLIKTRSRSRIIYYFNATAIAQDYETLKKDLDGWLEKIGNEMAANVAHKTQEPRKEQLNEDDQQFQMAVEKAKKHTDTAKKIIDADLITENNQKRAEIDADEIQVGKRLYKFSFGDVHEGFYHKKKTAVTLRVINNGVDNSTLSIIKRGILLTWHLQDCDYILRTHGLTLKDGNWIIVSEKTPNDTLYGMMKHLSIKQKDKITIAIHIALGLLYMHRSNIIHKDLRSHNIAMSNLTPKITGFEVCRDASNSTVQLQMDPYVKKWWSPERLAGVGSSKKSDVYAFGLVMYEISLGTEKVEAGEVDLGFESGNVSLKYSEIIRKCLAGNPMDRPDIQDIVNELTELQAAFIS